MKNVTFIALAALTMASCKKESPKDFEPIFEIAWTTYSTEVISRNYINGTLTSNDTNRTMMINDEVWHFKPDGDLVRYDNRNRPIGNTTYTKKEDSLIIQPGDIFQTTLRAKIEEFSVTDVTIVTSSETRPAPNRIDSVIVRMRFYRPS